MTRTRTTAHSRLFLRAITVSGLSLLCLQGLATRASAQLIAVKTLPIADGDQFFFFPSSNVGMAGVSIGLADSAHDLFVNPAKGGRIRRSYVFGAPTFFSVSGDAGAGSTLPVGVVARSGSSFGAVALAIQSITDGQRSQQVIPPPPLASGSFGDGSSSDASHSNRYGFAMAGHTFAASKLSIGASAFWSGLSGMDGVNLLYRDSRSLSQSGGSADIRFGMIKEWTGAQSLEALVLHQRAGMTDHVTYADQFWDPLARQVVERDRLAQDRDRTNTWGIQLQYERPIADSGWRVGARFSANRLDQPNTPELQVLGIPSDRGRSSAFNFGLGVARSQGNTRFAVDGIYEPIRSRLRAVTDSVMSTASGGTIEAGGTTMDNRLRFSNILLRAGLSQAIPLENGTSALMLMIGLQAHSIYYTLDQHDLALGATRLGDESWMEWMRSWGAVLRLPAVEIHYLARLTTGGGRPGAAFPSGLIAVDGVASSAPFPGPFTGTTTLSGVHVMTQQLSVSLPIR